MVLENYAHSAKGQGSLHSSSAVWSFALFAVLNAAFFVALRREPDTNGATTIVGQFLDHAEAPKAVILGSSVARHICSAVEPAALKELQILPLSYNLQMVSDSYLLIDKFLKGNKKPNLVVFCVCPRDFVDNDQPELIRTTTFRRFVSPIDLAGLKPALNLTFVDCTKAVYNYLCSIYDGRAAIQNRAAEWISVHATGSSSKECVPPTADAFWKRSVKEYKWRYEGINADLLAERMSVLRNSIALCHARGIKTIIVNAPLSEDNLRLLPQGFHENYVRQLKDTAAASSIKFIDLQASSRLSVNDFDDCAHVNKAGGKKVFTAIRPYFAQDKSCAQSKFTQL